jgi:hypothetical protein
VALLGLVALAALAALAGSAKATMFNPTACSPATWAPGKTLVCTTGDLNATRARPEAPAELPQTGASPLVLLTTSGAAIGLGMVTVAIALGLARRQPTSP